MQQEVVIKTSLKGRRELFQTLLIGELTQLPVLLIGDKGTGKTHSFFDYVMSRGGKPFTRQLTYDTRKEDLIGEVDLIEFRNGRLRRLNSIAEYDYILIDEIDKANSFVRNLLLSILREKVIFDGSSFVKCNWKLLVGTTNRYLVDEDDAPFIDRFVIKYEVDRLDVETLIGAVESPGSVVEERFIIKELDKTTLDQALNTYKDLIKEIQQFVSDRTIVLIPKIIETCIRLGQDATESVISALKYTVGRDKALKIVEKMEPDIVSQAKELIQKYHQSDDATKPAIVGYMLDFLGKCKGQRTSKEVEKLLLPIINKYYQIGNENNQ